MLGMIAIFCYVGGEIGIGSFLINFFKLGTIMGFEEAEGSKFFSFYWGGAMIGSFLEFRLDGVHANGLKKYALMAIFFGWFLSVYLPADRRQNDGGTFYFDLLPFSEISLFLLFFGNQLPGVLYRATSRRTLSIFAASVIALLLIMIQHQWRHCLLGFIAIRAFNNPLVQYFHPGDQRPGKYAAGLVLLW